MTTYVKYYDHHYMSGFGYGYISGYTHYNGGTYAVVVKQDNTIEEMLLVNVYVVSEQEYEDNIIGRWKTTV